MKGEANSVFVWGFTILACTLLLGAIYAVSFFINLENPTNLEASVGLGLAFGFTIAVLGTSSQVLVAFSTSESTPRTRQILFWPICSILLVPVITLSFYIELIAFKHINGLLAIVLGVFLCIAILLLTMYTYAHFCLSSDNDK